MKTVATRGWKSGRDSYPASPRSGRMRDEQEVREQYEFLKAELESEGMRHENTRRLFTFYKRALGWVLEEEYI